MSYSIFRGRSATEGDVCWGCGMSPRHCVCLDESPAMTYGDSSMEKPMKAHEFLESGLGHMKDRASTYDAPEGERSMGKTVAMFKALSGVEMTEEQGWKFMCCLKLVRSEQGDFRADNFEDLAAYAGLAGEAASKHQSGQTTGQTDAQSGQFNTQSGRGSD